MNNDTHDELMQTVLSYLKASEEFERRPSERLKRKTRRELRKLINLAKQRQQEVLDHYQDKLDGLRQDQKWQVHRKNPTT